MQGSEAFAMVSVTGMFFGTIYSVVRLIVHRPRKALPAAASADPALAERLERMEQAIQAIAIETERIAEGQRFTTRLLAHTDEPARGAEGRRALESGRS